MKRVLLLLSLLAVQGCVTQLTPEGSSVRIAGKSDECEFIGTVSASNSMGMSTADEAEGALNELRNKAADMGANAVRIINMDSDMAVTTALAEALKCDSE